MKQQTSAARPSLQYTHEATNISVGITAYLAWTIFNEGAYLTLKSISH